MTVTCLKAVFGVIMQWNIPYRDIFSRKILNLSAVMFDGVNDCALGEVIPAIFSYRRLSRCSSLSAPTV